MKSSTRRLLILAGALLVGPIILGAGMVYVVYLRSPAVREVVDSLFPRHRGQLVATLGIPLAEMHERSSLPISAGFTISGTTSGVFEPFFDWQVLGTSLLFRGCRFGHYNTDKSGVIDQLDVSVSPRRLRWSEMVEELRATGDQLRAAGFQPDTKAHTVSDDLLLAQWLARKPPAVDILSTDAFTFVRGDLKVVFYAEQQVSGRWVQRISLGRTTAGD